MEGREFVYLDTLAVIAVTFGGFAVIAVALRPDSHAKLSQLQALILRFLVEISLLVALMSLMPTLLFLFRVPPDLLWRLVSALALAAIVPWAVLYPFRRHAATGERFSAMVWLTLTAVAVSCLCLLANIVGLAVAAAAGFSALAPTVLLVMVWLNFLYRLELFIRGS